MKRLPIVFAVLLVLGQVATPQSALAMNGQQQAQFKQGMIVGCNRELDKRNNSEQLGLAKTQIQNYCSCSASETLRKVSTWNGAQLMMNGMEPTPAFMKVLKQSAGACQNRLTQ
jgi:hypothetical protein